MVGMVDADQFTVHVSDVSVGYVVWLEQNLGPLPPAEGPGELMDRAWSALVPSEPRPGGWVGYTGRGRMVPDWAGVIAAVAELQGEAPGADVVLHVLRRVAAGEVRRVLEALL